MESFPILESQTGSLRHGHSPGWQPRPCSNGEIWILDHPGQRDPSLENTRFRRFAADSTNHSARRTRLSTPLNALRSPACAITTLTGLPTNMRPLPPAGRSVGTITNMPSVRSSTPGVACGSPSTLPSASPPAAMDSITAPASPGVDGPCASNPANRSNRSAPGCARLLGLASTTLATYSLPIFRATGLDQPAGASTGVFHGHADALPDTRRPDSPVKHPGPLPHGPYRRGRKIWPLRPRSGFPTTRLAPARAGSAATSPEENSDRSGAALCQFTYAFLSRVFLEKVDGEYQGACFCFRAA